MPERSKRLDSSSIRHSSAWVRTPLCAFYVRVCETSWRNGSASDSRSEGCVFESRRGQNIFGIFRMFFVHSWKKIDCASNEDWTHDLWFTRPTLCHWAIEAYVYTWWKLCLERCSVPWHKNVQGTHGFEPWTYRTAADCSTTELYPLITICHVSKHRW